MRGKLRLLPNDSQSTGGSSPHAWETRWNAPKRVLVPRFIPTCVGNSCGLFSTSLLIAVHPHMRGKLFLVMCLIACMVGSSPHAWETHIRWCNHCWLTRFIPTCVGDSPKPILAAGIQPVHPHMRGRLFLTKCGNLFQHGSSPHAWETPRHFRHRIEYPTVHPHMRGRLGYCPFN